MGEVGGVPRQLLAEVQKHPISNTTEDIKLQYEIKHSDGG